MKKVSKLLLLVALLLTMTVPAWSQTSTQGTDFWVALTLSANPGGGDFKPFIAISKQDTMECTVTITSPSNTSWNGVTKKIKEAWTVISSAELNNSNWYNTNFASQAGTIQSQGLFVHSDKEISVFCAWQGTESFDASNILPITVLQSDYIVQDYPPYDNDGATSYSTFAIVATEDNTIVDITPSEKTYDNHAAGTTYQPARALMKGEVYHVLSSKETTLSGTRVTAQGGKKIAVFNGDVMTRVPDKKMGNRDLLYEQAMPTDYWGTQFVVTRSLRKDANRIRVTAMENGTTISINGEAVKTINSGKTYEFELAMLDFVPKSQRESALPDSIIYADDAFISTSCPCAVYSYDVGKSYRGKDGATETSNDYGDPSMVWISPLEQSIKHITFGVCGTNYTKDHCINIVKLTADKTVTLKDSKGNNMLTSADVFIPVPGNKKYSYLRKLLVDNKANVTESFTLTSDDGVIAHIYGSGQNESYAYSAGSSAVALGTITVGTQTFENGTFSNIPICVNDIYTFDATAGTTIIDQIDWDFDDGTTATVYEASTTHKYTSPGWYDVTARLYAHKNCPDTVYPPFDVKFTFRVVRADTVYKSPEFHCITVDGKLWDENKQQWVQLTEDSIAKLLANGADVITQGDNCYDTVYITPVSFGRDSKEQLPDTIGHDFVYGYNGKRYDADAHVIDTIPAHGSECMRIQEYNVKVLQCLGIDINNKPNEQHACLNESKTLPISYNWYKGEIKNNKVIFTINELPKFKQELEISKLGTVLNLPMEDDNKVKVEKPGYYTGKITMEDPVCDETNPREFTVNFTVYYPSDIFQFKFNNVLAVYKPGYGGNKDLKAEFTEYQWYRNGVRIGGNVSALYLGEGITFNDGDVVYVELTDKNGLKLPSCPQTLTVPDLSPQPNNAPAKKVIQNQKIVIIREEKTYNIYGQRVQ